GLAAFATRPDHTLRVGARAIGTLLILYSGNPRRGATRTEERDRRLRETAATRSATGITEPASEAAGPGSPTPRSRPMDPRGRSSMAVGSQSTAPAPPLPT